MTSTLIWRLRCRQMTRATLVCALCSLWITDCLHDSIVNYYAIVIVCLFKAAVDYGKNPRQKRGQNMIYRSSACRLPQLLARCREYPSIYRVNCESDRHKHNEWCPYRITDSRQELLMRVARSPAVRVVRTTRCGGQSALVFAAAIFHQRPSNEWRATRDVLV